MRNAKRFAIAILTLVLLASCALLTLVACQGGCKVTLNYDSTKGTASISEPQNGGSKYEKGETVLVLVQPKSGYKVASFSVTGHEDAKLSNGQYTFEVLGNTVVDVKFAELEGNYYKVTVNCDEGATVTLDPAPEDYGYLEGTVVTATLQLQQGYDVGTVYVDNAISKFVDNKLTFTVYHDTLVEVSVYKAVPSSVLQSLTGDVMFTGEVYESTSDDTALSDYYYFIAMYDTAKQLVWQMEDGLYNTSDIVFGCDEQGYVSVPTHGFNGELTWLRQTDEYGNELPFISYDNPFKYLTAADFIFLKNGEPADEYDSIWGLNETASHNVLKALTGYDYDVKAFEMVVKDGAVTEIVFTTNTYRSGPRNYYTKGEFAVSKDISQYALDDEILTPKYDEQNELKQALQQAKNATSYKVTHGYSDGSYTGYESYMVGDTVWTQGDEYSYGYVMRQDGQLWPFSIEDAKMVLGRKAAGTSVRDAAAKFDLGSVDPSMFKQDADGRYVLRDHDLNGIYGQYLVNYITQSFATGGLEMNEFNQIASNVAITLKDGALYKVEVLYYAYDDNFNIVEKAIELIFGEFGEAKLPIDLTPYSDVIEGTIPVNYLGVWVGSNPYVRVEVALDTVTIDGAVSTSVTDHENSIYTVVVYGQTHELKADGDSIQLDGVTLHRRECDWEEMFGTYSGWQQYEYYGEYYTDELELTINAQGVQFTVADADGDYSITRNISKDEFKFSEENGKATISFTFEEDGEEYEASVMLLAKNAAINFYVIVSDGYFYYEMFDIDAYVEGYDNSDWSIFVGEYTGDGYTLNIEEETITLTHNGQSIQFANDKILYYAVEYVVPTFAMINGNTVYILEQYGGSNNKLRLFVGEDYAATLVKKEPQMESWSKFAGKYDGEYTKDEETVKYSIDVTADDVTLWIGSQSYKATVTDFDSYIYSDSNGYYYNLYTFTFTCGNGASQVTYTLRQYEEGWSDMWVLMYEDADANEIALLLELVKTN